MKRSHTCQWPQISVLKRARHAIYAYLPAGITICLRGTPNYQFHDTALDLNYIDNMLDGDPYTKQNIFSGSVSVLDEKWNEALFREFFTSYTCFSRHVTCY